MKTVIANIAILLASLFVTVSAQHKYGCNECCQTWVPVSSWHHAFCCDPPEADTDCECPAPPNAKTMPLEADWVVLPKEDRAAFRAKTRSDFRRFVRVDNRVTRRLSAREESFCRKADRAQAKMDAKMARGAKAQERKTARKEKLIVRQEKTIEARDKQIHAAQVQLALERGVHLNH
uniref:Uncharacterized protein n=1 Tax=Ditylum brightwellii TaxID=49249 RepID=A0A6U3QY90_9STRA|mmetsp:Transcript_24042/g.35847  ORF Transcript_24042/g.35847 Transcript_24042/m.35847 type:complete len:177 (+) Transcript_24042:133-663(+)